MSDDRTDTVLHVADEKSLGDLRSAVGRLARMIEKELSPGDVASLRRLDPGDPSVPAFWKVLAASLDDMLPSASEAREAVERRWAAILCAMSNARGLHRPRIPLGAALAEAGFSELRFTRLLRARGDQMFPSVRGAAQYLASKAIPFDAHDLARLVLSEDGPSEEKVRRDIARAYYRLLSSKSPRTENAS
jgi:CRISPR system Cascade subunit CasB